MDPGSASAQQPHGDDIEELRRKAQGAKKESQTKKRQIPPFIQKLNRYVTLYVSMTVSLTAPQLSR